MVVLFLVAVFLIGKHTQKNRKKAKAANRDKRRVSFSSLHNVRFFSSDTNNNSPSKRRKVVEIATPQEEDDFAREKDLLSLDFANEDSQLPSGSLFILVYFLIIADKKYLQTPIPRHPHSDNPTSHASAETPSALCLMLHSHLNEEHHLAALFLPVFAPLRTLQSHPPRPLIS
jgi:hypothetical protein